MIYRKIVKCDVFKLHIPCPMAVLTVIKKLGPGVITAIPQRIATLSNIIENFIKIAVYLQLNDKSSIPNLLLTSSLIHLTA